MMTNNQKLMIALKALLKEHNATIEAVIGHVDNGDEDVVWIELSAFDMLGGMQTVWCGKVDEILDGEVEA